MRTKIVTRKLQEDSRGMVDDVDCDKGGNLDLNTDNTNKELNTDNNDKENEIDKIKERICKSVSSEYDRELYFYELFENGMYENIPPDFHKIMKEIDYALEIEERNSSNVFTLDDFIKINNEVERALLQDNSCNNINDEFEEEEEIDFFSDEEDEYDEEVENNDSKKGMIKKIVIGSSVLIISLGVYGGYKSFSNRNSLDSLETQIERLYTSSRKDGIKNGANLDKYYDKLDNLGDSDRSKALRSELDCISQYMADMKELDYINSSSYDLGSSDLLTKLSKIVMSAMGYSVAGLSNTVKSTVDTIDNDYKSYISLRDSLSSVSNYSDFNISYYQKKVNEVSHKPNKEELQGMLDKISDSIKLDGKVEDIKNATENKIEEASNGIIENIGNFFSSLIEGVKNILR